MNTLNIKENVSTDHIRNILHEAHCGRAVSKSEAVFLLSLDENSFETSLLRQTADYISRSRFGNKALLLGQIGVDMAPCDGDCAFCFFAKSNTSITPSVLPEEEIISRCIGFAEGGARGAFLMTMHSFGFDWFRDLVSRIKLLIPAGFELLANTGDLEKSQLAELKDAGISGAYHVCRLREGIDSCMAPSVRVKTIETILETGMDWYNMCEPIGPEHSPEELVEQIWTGIELPCVQHGAMQRFPVPGSPLFGNGSISLQRLSQIIAVIVLASSGQKSLRSVAANVASMTALFSGANAFFPEAGEPVLEADKITDKGGFTTASWRRSDEITTRDCRDMISAAGFRGLI